MRTNAELYDQDFYAWTQAQAALLREGAVHDLDVINLAEELSDLGSNLTHAVHSHLYQLLRICSSGSIKPSIVWTAIAGKIPSKRPATRFPGIWSVPPVCGPRSPRSSPRSIPRLDTEPAAIPTCPWRPSRRYAHGRRHRSSMTPSGPQESPHHDARCPGCGGTMRAPGEEMPVASRATARSSGDPTIGTLRRGGCALQASQPRGSRAQPCCLACWQRRTGAIVHIVSLIRSALATCSGRSLDWHCWGRVEMRGIVPCWSHVQESLLSWKNLPVTHISMHPDPTPDCPRMRPGGWRTPATAVVACVCPGRGCAP